MTLKHLSRHTGLRFGRSGQNAQVPPKGAEGEGRSQIVRPFQIMPFQISSVRLSPSAPYDGAPPRMTGEGNELCPSVYVHL